MRRKMLVVLALVVSLLVVGSASAADFDLTQFGLQPAENYDFGGETVTIISWTSERMENYFNDDLVLMGRVELAEEIFNCEIEFLQTRDIPEVPFNRLLAGESGNDLWHVQNKIGYWELVSQGALYDISEVLPAEYFDMLPPSLSAVEEALRFEGKTWGIGPVEWRPLFGYQNDMVFVAYNNTLFEREGLPDPYELYLDGEWTWEAATDIAVKATVDIDGDGEIDQWGIADARAWDLAVSNGAALTRVDENGKVVFTGDEPAYLEALEQYREWWSELQVQMPTYSSDDLKNSFLNGQVAMFFYAGAWQLPDVLAGMADEWTIVPYPRGPQAEETQWTVQALNTTVIPTNANDPEALIAIKTFLWREEDVTVSDLLANHVANQESADVFITGNNEWNGNASRLFQDYYATYDEDVREVASGDVSPAALMAELKPVIQANLDDLLNQ